MVLGAVEKRPPKTLGFSVPSSFLVSSLWKIK